MYFPIFSYLHILCTLLILILFFKDASSGKNHSGVRIFQGRDAEPGEFPYVVALAIKYTENTHYESFHMFCTGSTITQMWVLSAGHCMLALQTFKARLPTGNNTKTETLKPVIRYISPENKWLSTDIIRSVVHPGFQIIDQKEVHININDIALVNINKISDAKLGKLSFVNFRTIYGHNVLTAGLGNMGSENKEDSSNSNRPLQVLEALVVQCPPRREVVVLPTSFCLTWKCKKLSTCCPGDSGGPIVHLSGIIGITIGGDNRYCDDTRDSLIANIATPISTYVDWIYNNINK